jgi:putative drug exporter of the RND superfamily
MFKILGRFAAIHPWTICAAWLIGGLCLFWLAPVWDSKAQDDDIRFLPARCPSVRGYQLLSRAFPKDVFASRLIFALERPDTVLTDADFILVDSCVHVLEQLRCDAPELQLGKVLSYRDPLTGRRLTSQDRRCTLIEMSLNTPYLALQTRAAVDRADALLRQRLSEAGPDAPRLLTTGPAGIGRDLTRASADSLKGTTLATVLLVVVVLLLVYRAPLLALVPLITIAVSVWVSLQALALLTLIPGIYLVNVSKVFAIVILYGAGTDYCLFLISRYCEELENGHGGRRALSRSVGVVGSALAASAGTVICGLGLMGSAEFAKVRCAGPAIALSLAVALLASLTLTPALLRLLGRAAFWPRSRGWERDKVRGWENGRVREWGARRTRSRKRLSAPALSFSHSPTLSPSYSLTRSHFWDWIAQSVVARPVLVWSSAVLALTPLAVLGFWVSPLYKATGELHPSAGSVQGLAAVQRHFTAGEIGPLTVLLRSSTDWNTPPGREALAHLSRGFALLPNVAEVRSLTQPLGIPLPVASPDTGHRNSLRGLIQSVRHDMLSGALDQAQHAARDFYLAELPDGSEDRFVARMDVVFHSDPFGTDSWETLELIETWLDKALPDWNSSLGSVRGDCYGVPVSARDLAQVTEGDRLRVNVLVLTAIFLILLLLVRRLWLAAYLLVTVLFSYYCTLGATALVGSLWAGRALGYVDWRVPFFLFTILVAVGEDYNILLITRILQERKRHGTEEGTRRAVARTGGTITSCGLIMAGTFSTLMLAGLGTLVQIGFALAFGVLLDTFVVRPFLVPAFTLLVWRWQDQQRARGGKVTTGFDRRAA